MGLTTRCKWAAGVLKSHFQELKDFYEIKNSQMDKSYYSVSINFTNVTNGSISSLEYYPSKVGIVQKVALASLFLSKYSVYAIGSHSNLVSLVLNGASWAVRHFVTAWGWIDYISRLLNIFWLASLRDKRHKWNDLSEFEVSDPNSILATQVLIKLDLQKDFGLLMKPSSYPGWLPTKKTNCHQISPIVTIHMSSSRTHGSRPDDRLNLVIKWGKIMVLFKDLNFITR